MTRLRLAVVGVGHLGKEHARILSQLPEVDLVGVVDPRPAQATAIAERCGCRALTDHRELLTQVDAVVIAAPTAHHSAVAGSFLRRAIPVLIEKPIAADLQQAEELALVAEERGTILQVGHIERFNPAFEELQRRSFQPKFITCERLGGFTGRSTDVGVVLDLMIHDLDLVLSLVRAPVRSVEALGVAVLGGHEDVAQARVTFADGCVAQFSASRIHPTPARRMTVWAPEGFAAVDFAQRTLTLTQPNRAALNPSFDSRRLDAVTAESVRSELHSRYLQTCQLECASKVDQLTCELQEFVHCVRTGDRPRVDGAAGRDAVYLATQILTSLRSHAWNGNAAAPCGPSSLPTPLGSLFLPTETKAVA